MSHFTHIETKIRCVASLKEAAKELGITVLQNTKARGYAGNSHQGEYVLKLSGPYDVALNMQADGTYGLTADLWAGHVERELGQNYSKLKQLYGIHKTSREAKARGLTVRRQSLPSGKLRLTLTQVGAR